jgi:adenylate kinase
MVDLVMLGAPGAGKGTQAELLVEWLGLPRISSGDLFRANIGAGTALGLEAKGDMDRGELVPDTVTIGMVAARIAEPDCANGVIFDGFPRTVAQAQALDGILAEMGRKVALALNVRVAEAELLRRLAGRWTCRQCSRVYHQVYSPEQVKGICDACGGALYQRADDTPETQQRRIQVYLGQAAPVENYYAGQGVLVHVDGEQGIQAVQAALRGAIEKVLA